MAFWKLWSPWRTITPHREAGLSWRRTLAVLLPGLLFCSLAASSGCSNDSSLAACVSSEECSGGELCISGSCRETCGADNPCSGPLPLCDLTTMLCEECLTDEDCSEGLCVDRACQPACSSDSDCAGGQECNAARGLCRSIGCGTSADCLTGETCTAGRCEPPECELDTDCPEAGRGCIAGVCVPPECIVSDDCPRGATCRAGVCDPECSTDSDCADDRQCNGREVCRTGFCVEGTSVSCADEVLCTVDSCREPTGLCEHEPDDSRCGPTSSCYLSSGCGALRTCRVDLDCNDGVTCTADRCDFDSDTCSSIPTDADGDGVAALGCLGGLDCDDDDDSTFPGASDVCDGVDRDCNGVIDDGAGLACARGSAPQDCVTGCGTAGTRACSSTCSFDACLSPVEVCRNDCDDDGDGSIDEDCPPVPTNDTCATAIAVTHGSVRSDLMGSALRSTSDCGDGGEIFYSIDLAVRTIVYISTLGTTFDTMISHRGVTCPGLADGCVDDACGGAQSQWVGVVPAGLHYFAVHAAAGSPPANVELRVDALPAGTFSNRLLPGSPTSGSTRVQTGTLSGTGSLAYGCGAVLDAPESTVYWTQCVGERRTVTIEDCRGPGEAVAFDAVINLIGPAGELACADNNLVCEGDTERIELITSGQGLFQSILDSAEIAPSGAFYHRVRISAPL